MVLLDFKCYINVTVWVSCCCFLFFTCYIFEFSYFGKQVQFLKFYMVFNCRDITYFIKIFSRGGLYVIP